MVPLLLWGRNPALVGCVVTFLAFPISGETITVVVTCKMLGSLWKIYFCKKSLEKLSFKYCWRYSKSLNYFTGPAQENYLIKHFMAKITLLRDREEECAAWIRCCSGRTAESPWHDPSDASPSGNSSWNGGSGGVWIWRLNFSPCHVEKIFLFKNI